MNTSIHHSKEICKRLSENNLLESVKTVSEPYVISVMKSMFQAGYHGKTIDMERCSDRHRTSISCFLRNESIIDDTLELSMKQHITDTVSAPPLSASKAPKHDGNGYAFYGNVSIPNAPSFHKSYLRFQALNRFVFLILCIFTIL